MSAKCTFVGDFFFVSMGKVHDAINKARRPATSHSPSRRTIWPSSQRARADGSSHGRAPAVLGFKAQ